MENSSVWWLPILLYHRVNTERDPLGLAVEPARFERQLKWLKRLGYRTLAMRDLATALESGRKPAGRRVIITFDDGYRDCYTTAWPLLQKYGFGATVYLVSDYIGRDSSFDKGLPPGVGPWPLMNYAQIQEMQRTGIEFGSHGATHQALDSLTPDEQQDEVTRSRQELEQKLGQPVTTFSYPYGRVAPADLTLLSQAGYHTAVSGLDVRFEKLCLSRLDLTALPMRALPFEVSPALHHLQHQPLYRKFRQALIKPRGS